MSLNVDGECEGVEVYMNTRFCRIRAEICCVSICETIVSDRVFESMLCLVLEDDLFIYGSDLTKINFESFLLFNS